MNSIDGSLAWSLPQVARLLSSDYIAHGVFILALCPTTESRLKNNFDLGNYKFISSPPDCLIERIFDEQYPDIMRFDSETGLNSVWGPFVGNLDQDCHFIHQPLIKLSISGSNNREILKIRTVDDLYADLGFCGAIFFESDNLIEGAHKIIGRHKPLLILKNISSLRQRDLKEYGYLPVRPLSNQQMGAEYFVFSTNLHDIVLSSLPLLERAEVALPPLVSNARWQRGSKTLVWTNRAPGMAFMAEQPAGSSRVRIKLFSSSPHGLNIFMQGDRVEARAIDVKEDKFEVIEINFPQTVKDSLCTILLSPIRLSTTDPAERLEFIGFKFM